ncbi:ADP-dependent glucokinase/phosphofructokinase [Methanosarcina flavescens]|jgi:ADP-dependent phosphofructokinase/glucokinase|uniref:ADP-dependent glucokinase n=1 Tax=Methanosarcina flavescens TaxID=1715806 RepID=A0A660HUY4_9EURY|nr:ADP-dependent glucokinase/phosphofructokinase [Methanosarcina flavescens]AYK15675.1 ADP-dependent glucokinase [Methanosarcina flavescens]
MNILCGYNVNIDSVYRITGAEISELLSAFEAAEILEKIENPPGKIISESDFVAGLAYCMKEGCGAEWLVFEDSVFEFLKNRYFEKSLVRMGGNAGIMANALSQLGASRVIPNVAVPSETQLSLFSKKAIYLPEAFTQQEKNAGILPEKSEEDLSSNQEPIHFVFDFSEGETFSLYGTEVRVPRENRFIATCDHLNFRLYTNPAFKQYALQHACELDGILISGFHLLIENYPDGTTYKTILDNSFSELTSWKSRNDKLQIHLELGHFASREIGNSVFLKFSGLSDSFGMNEDELAMFYNLHGVPGEKLLHMEAEAVADAACRLASRNELKKLFIHTREFVLNVFKPGFNPNSEQDLQRVSGEKLEALEFGVKCAGVYAASGKLDGREFVEEEALKLQESEFGRKQIEAFLKAFNGKTLRQGAYAFRGGYVICMLPTMLSQSPVTTVGLGDTLTAAIFLRGLELDVQA